MRFRRASLRPRLDGGDVAVWRASLRQPAGVRAALRRTLSGDECARADRLVIESKREQSVVSRGVLRNVLSRYVGVPATELAFRYGDDGRPSLDTDAPAVDFNVTHSADLLLIAVTARPIVGIDVELVRSAMDHRGIGTRFFSQREQADLATAGDVPEAFFRCWTRKEAVLKARGTGLRTPLDRFDVTLLATDPPRVRATRFSPPDERLWWLTSFRPLRGYVGAVCTDDGERPVRGYRIGARDLSH